MDGRTYGHIDWLTEGRAGRQADKQTYICYSNTLTPDTLTPQHLTHADK